MFDCPSYNCSGTCTCSLTRCINSFRSHQKNRHKTYSILCRSFLLVSVNYPLFIYDLRSFRKNIAACSCNACRKIYLLNLGMVFKYFVCDHTHTIRYCHFCRVSLICHQHTATDQKVLRAVLLKIIQPGGVSKGLRSYRSHSIRNWPPATRWWCSWGWR